MSLLALYVGFGLVTAAILALAAVGFTMQYEVTNVLNLAYGQVLTVAALAAYAANQMGGDLWVMLAAGAGSGAILSVALNRFVFTPFVRRGLKLFGMIVITIATALVIGNVCLIIFGFGTFSYGLTSSSTYRLAGMIFTGPQLDTIVLAILAMGLIRVILVKTKIGRAMRATATDPALARASGIQTGLVSDAAWAISGALCGLAGVAAATSVSAWSVTTGDGLLITIVAAAIVGGIGQPYGAMLGAVLIGLVTSLVGGYLNPSYTDISAFLILTLFLLLRPAGLIRGVVLEREVIA